MERAGAAREPSGNLVNESKSPYGYSSIRLIGIGHAGAQFGPVGYEINLLYITTGRQADDCSPARVTALGEGSYRCEVVAQTDARLAKV